MTLRRRLGLPLLAAGLLLASCSGRPRLAEVSGTVKMDGKRLANVKVDFHPDPDRGSTGPGSSGTTDAGGNFTLTCSDGRPGAVVGNHRIILTDLDVYGNKFVGRGDYRSESPTGAPVEVPKKARFPEVYSDLTRTPLKEVVRGGLPPVVIEIKR